MRTGFAGSQRGALYSLEKSRRRDPKAPDYGRFRLVDPKSTPCRTVLGDEPFPFSASFEDVERWLEEKEDYGSAGAGYTQVFKKIEALERDFGRFEDE
jgi:hypothetical protein